MWLDREALPALLLANRAVAQREAARLADEGAPVGGGGGQSPDPHAPSQSPVALPQNIMKAAAFQMSTGPSLCGGVGESA